MNFQENKDQELLLILDNLEKAYNPSSPNYRFSHVFYNIVDHPFERPPNFPVALWNKALQDDKSLMPVILNKDQINKRKVLQTELAKKLNSGQLGLYKKAENLKVKREMVKSKMQTVVQKYRNVMKRHIHGMKNDRVYKIAMDLPGRESYSIGRDKTAIIKCLAGMKERLLALNEKICKIEKEEERRAIMEHKLNQG